MGEAIELIQHKAEENEDFKLAHKYMNRYVDSLVDEYKVRKENAVLLESLDTVVAELRDIKGELTEIKQQNAALTESMQYLDITRLTVGRGGVARQRAENDPEVDMRNTARLPKLRAEEYNEIFTPKTEPPPEDSIIDTLKDSLKGVLEDFREDIRKDSGETATGADGEDYDGFGDGGLVLPEQPGAQDATIRKKPKNKAVTIISNVLFYACMALLIIGAITFAQSTDVDKSLFGFRYYYIKTASMEPVLPVGSVVFTKVTPPEDIKVGDDITVYIGDGQNDTYLTHRVVEITQDANGELAFRTKGVNNKSNDPTPFNAKMLTGKVVFCIPFLGTVMTFVQSQLIFVIGIFVLLLALSFMLRLLFAKEEPGQLESAAGADGESKPKRAGKDGKATGKPRAEAKPKQSGKTRRTEEKQRQEEMLRKIQEEHDRRVSQKLGR